MKAVSQLTESFYLRNFRVNAELSECVNNVGGFVCVDQGPAGEMVALGFGGHTTDGGVYPPQVLFAL